MKFINTDGMAFIGPGSEWFWTAISGLVLAVTFLAIYRQLSIARSANAFDQLNRIVKEWGSEPALRHMLEIQLALRAGTGPESVPEGAARFVGDFWEPVGLLVRTGHVDRRLVYEYVGPGCQWCWAALAPLSRRHRIDYRTPKLYEHFEWLAGLMAEMDRKAGVDHPFDLAYLAGTLDLQIQINRDQIRVAEELRAVIVRPLAPAAHPAPPPSARDAAASAGPRT